MTKFVRIIYPLLCGLPFLFGCKTVSAPELIAFVSARAGEAAQLAVEVDLKSNPENRAFYVAGVAALKGLSQSSNYSSVDFKAALAALPIFQGGGTAVGDYGGIVLTVGVTVYDLITMFCYDVQSAPALASVTLSIIAGIEAALDAKPALSSRNLDADPKTPKLVPRKTVRI